MEKMNLAIDQLKLKYQPIISQNAEVLELKKNEHLDLIARKQKLDEKLAQIDKNSGTYVIHSIDRCRNQVADLNQTLAMKKEYQKRLISKLNAYKEIAALIRQHGSSQEKISELLQK